MILLDTEPLQRALARWPTSLPYAIRNAMDTAADRAMPAIRRDFERTFTTRGTWETQSIRRTYTSRALEARIGSMHEYMAPHLYGGLRVGESWVPFVGPGRPRTRKETRTTPARWPSAMLRRPRAFALPGRILERTRTGLRTLYLRRRVGIRATWRLPEAVRREVGAQWHSAMKEAIEKEIARRGR